MSDPVAAPVPRKVKPSVLKDMGSISTATSQGPSPALSPALTQNSPMSKKNLHLPSLLEELLDDCFQYLIDPKWLCDTRAEYVQSFHKFLTSRHAHENLLFVIEIFRYEYFYDKIHPENVQLQKTTTSHSSLSANFLNQSLEHFIDSMPYPTSSMQRKVHKGTRSRSSLQLLSVHMGFDFDDIPPSSSEAWDVLKDQAVSSDDESSLHSVTSKKLFDAQTLLADQWNLIMREFIDENSPQQVNLCDDTVRELKAEDQDKQTSPNPIVLVKVKTEVMQLLEENAYSPFMRTQKAELNGCACKGKCEFDGSGDFDSLRENSLRVKQSSPLSMPQDREICMNTPSRLGLATPLPQLKFKTKLLSHLSANSESSSSGSSLSSFMHHFKTNLGSGTTRLTSSVPHLGVSSKAHSPVPEIDRPSSTIHDGSPSILTKLWRKKSEKR